MNLKDKAKAQRKSSPPVSSSVIPLTYLKLSEEVKRLLRTDVSISFNVKVVPETIFSDSNGEKSDTRTYNVGQEAQALRISINHEIRKGGAKKPIGTYSYVDSILIHDKSENLGRAILDIVTRRFTEDIKDPEERQKEGIALLLR